VALIKCGRLGTQTSKLLPGVHNAKSPDDMISMSQLVIYWLWSTLHH